MLTNDLPADCTLSCTQPSYGALMMRKLAELASKSPSQLANILRSAAKRCKSGQHEAAKAENRELLCWVHSSTKCLDEL